jgi:hypothetical protein
MEISSVLSVSPRLNHCRSWNRVENSLTGGLWPLPCEASAAPLAPRTTTPCTAPLQLSGLTGRGHTMPRVAEQGGCADRLLTAPEPEPC